MDYFGYGIEDVILCEICQKRGNDIHHVENRKMGGDKTKDAPENLMCLCRFCHTEYGDVPELIEVLKKIHLNRMKNSTNFL
jgi:hypothetical protein